MRAGTQRALFYAGLALVTAATLMLQIIETRIISVTSWYHLAFFVIGIAMFGLTAGAVWVYLHRERFAPAHLAYHLSAATLGCALSLVATAVAQLTIATSGALSLTAAVAWTELALCLAAPFFFSGIVVSLALTRSPYPVGEVYGADLVGAAAGCLGVLALLGATSGPASLLWLSVLLALAALGFASSGPLEPPHGGGAGWWLVRRRGAILLALAGLALVNEATAFGVRPIVVKDRFETPRELAFDRWNSFSRITVAHSGEGPPALWGPSPLTPPSRIAQRWMTIDGATGTSMARFGGDLRDVSFLRYDVTNLAYALPGLKTGAVIGVGGGRDILSAKLFGLDHVVGVEINPIFVSLLTDRFRAYSAVADLPGVELAVDEARSWFARAERSFDVIQMSLVDTWAATGAGAFTLSENGLYTTEAWRIFLARLKPNGVFTVSRWYSPTDVNETGRVLSLAVAALLASGAEDPRRHILLASAGNIATLVLAKSPLSGEAVTALDERAKALGFEVLVAPDRPPASSALAGIVGSKSLDALAAATRDAFLDLSPPTDARPFFFNQLRFSRLFDWNVFTEFQNPGVFGGNLTATITLVTLVVVSALLVLATIVLPLRATVRNAGWTLALAGTSYFALIGIGFMMTEIALLQRMSVFLGHPVYALSVVLFSLILATGLGSLLSERWTLGTPGRLAAWCMAVAAYLIALPAWLPPLLLDLDSGSLLIRAGFCVLVLAPAGLAMGFGFPTGMRLVSAIDRQPTPWFWGINGAAGVLATGLAVLTSLAFGIDTTLRIGGLSYLLLIAPALMLARRARAEPASEAERAVSPAGARP